MKTKTWLLFCWFSVFFIVWWNVFCIKKTWGPASFSEAMMLSKPKSMNFLSKLRVTKCEHALESSKTTEYFPIIIVFLDICEFLKLCGHLLHVNLLFVVVWWRILRIICNYIFGIEMRLTSFSPRWFLSVAYRHKTVFQLRLMIHKFVQKCQINV